MSADLKAAREQLLAMEAQMDAFFASINASVQRPEAVMDAKASLETAIASAGKLTEVLERSNLGYLPSTYTPAVDIAVLQKDAERKSRALEDQRMRIARHSLSLSQAWNA